MFPVERLRGLLPVVNIKSVVLNSPDAINDSVHIGTTAFSNRSGKSLDIKVKTTSITNADNSLAPSDAVQSEVPFSIPGLRFADHMRVCIIQSRNSEFTGMLKSLGENITKYIGPLNQWRGNSKFDDMVSSNVLKKLNVPKEQLSVFKSNFMDIQTKKLFGDIDSPLLEKVDDDGVVIKSIPINFDFTIDQFNPKHLSYFVIPYIDLESLATSVENVGGTPDKDGDFTSLGLTGADFEVLGRISTPLKYDVVFDGGNVSGDSFFYKTGAGKIWTGPMHRMPNGRYMTGNSHTTASKYLTVVTTRNVKIQDFRVREGITTVGVMDDFQDEAQTVRNIIRRLQPKNRSLNPSNNSKDSFISDLFLSTGARKSSKFMFLINMDDLLSRNSLFGNLIRTNDLTLRDKVFDRSVIKSLKIYRQTVKKVLGTNEVGGTIDKYLETDEAPVLIGSTFQKEGKKRIEPLSNLTEESNMSFSDTGVRSFNVVDRNFSAADMSQYQYRVEVQIVDRTLNYLREEVDKLRGFANTLENYQSDILNSTIRPRLETDDPYIKDKSRTLVRNRSIGGFDYRFGNLTPNFAKKMKEKYGAGIKSGIESFIEILKIFSEEENFTIKQQTKLDNYLNLMLTPNVTNPSNVGTTIQLIQDSIGKISSYIGQNVRHTIPVENKANYIVGFGESVFSTHGAIKIEKKFGNILDLSLHGKGAYDYLSLDIGDNAQDTANQIGLKTLGGKEYRGRVIAEILKYFTTAQPDLTQGMSGQATKYAGGDSAQNTGFSFLTPSVVRFSETAIDTLNGGQVENPTLMKFLESKLIINKTISDGNGEVPPFDASFNTNSFVASQQSLNALQLAPTEQRGFLSETYNLVPTSEKLIPLSETIRISSSPTPPTQDESERTENEIVNLPSMYPSSFFERIFKRAITGKIGKGQVAQQENISLFDLDQNVNFLKGVEQSKVAKLPNQLKALFISITSGNGNQTIFRAQERKDIFNDPDFAASATMKYKLISEVEYLTGFSTDNMSNRKKLLMTAPNFSRLTSDAFSTFTGKKVLCRLRKYEVPEWGITRPTLLDTLVYDEYFIIQPDTPVAGANPLLPSGLRAAVAAAGWDLSAEEYALLAEFGTSFLPAASPFLQSDNMQNIAQELAGFAEKVDNDPVTLAFNPPAPRSALATTLSELRRQLQEINVLIAGLQNQLGAQESTINTVTQQLTDANASLGGSTSEQRDALMAKIAEYNGSLASTGAAITDTTNRLNDLKQQRQVLLAEIQEVSLQISTAYYTENLEAAGECPADFQDAGTTLAGVSMENAPDLQGELTSNTEAVAYSTEPDYEMIAKFNDFTTTMSVGDAEEFELLLAELESLGPEGIQQANQLRAEGTKVFTSELQLCADARGRRDIASYLSGETPGEQINMSITQIVNSVAGSVWDEFRVGGLSPEVQRDLAEKLFERYSN